MHLSVRTSVMALAAMGSLALAAPAAWAGCGDGGLKAPASWNEGPIQAGDARIIRTANGNGVAGIQSIVGLWEVQFFVGSNLFDFGYAEWHDDGTEIMNSGGRAPSTGNFCMGAWTATGPFSYALNHFALSYDGATGKLNGKINIKENVQLQNKGQTFNGTFTIDVYDPATNAAVNHVSGTIIGKRLSAD